MQKVQNLVVGCGLSGAVLAERLASVYGEEVLLIDRRGHIGGNIYDYKDESTGITVHQYGPHVFHTNSQEVWNYLSQFTQWHRFMYRVKAVIDGKEVNIPFNLDGLYKVFPHTLAEKLEIKLLDLFGFNIKVPILELRKSQDKDKEQLWEELLDMKEKNSIRTLNRALDSSGKALFGNRWPRVPVPGAVGEETFRMQPDVFKYIVPAKTGIIIGSPSGFDDSMQEYLKSMGMFYPILTFTIPIPDDIQKSKFSDAIYVKLQQNIPGAVVRNGRINITLLPDLDSLNHLIYKTREALVSGRG